ncbi:MAG: TIM barrel protein [Planctomycetaceae bacterium]
MNFAPHFGMFEQSAGEDLVDQLKFAADQGFAAWEDNRMKLRPLEDQNRIAGAMEKLGIRMGVISATLDLKDKINFTSEDAAAREEILQHISETVEVARRLNVKWLTVVPGLENPRLPYEYQMVNCIELLKQCCDLLEPHELTMVLEPLNHFADHPGMFLKTSPQAFLLCKAVNHPSCKILFDIYHQQISEGNLIPNIDQCWSEIGYFQAGDNPGRNEPGTGEINYKNVFQHISNKGFTGIVGMEHSNSKPGQAGEQAVIDAYRAVDPV